MSYGRLGPVVNNECARLWREAEFYGQQTENAFVGDSRDVLASQRGRRVFG